MKYAEARENIYSSFVEQWNNFTDFTLDNEDFDPGEDAWVRITVRSRDGQQGSLGTEGNRRFDRAGVVFVQIFTPLNKGTAEMGSITEKVLEIFEGKRIADTTICFHTARPKELGPEGVWYNSTVEVGFTYQEIK